MMHLFGLNGYFRYLSNIESIKANFLITRFI
jgi:hypothetical protein